ncbi:MAG TPA: hypothetical protein VFQ60_00540, partial [Patescibacteria group bacterium]|nr:hypothetical protein [Patescibacteria group bacterium]
MAKKMKKLKKKFHPSHSNHHRIKEKKVKPVLKSKKKVEQHAFAKQVPVKRIPYVRAPVPVDVIERLFQK